MCLVRRSGLRSRTRWPRLTYAAAAEKNAGWTLLFDGKSLDGWRPYNKKPAGGWEVVDGTLHAALTPERIDSLTAGWQA